MSVDRQGDPVRAFLNSVLEYRMEISRLRRKIEQLESRATNTTSQMTGMPHGGGADRDAVLVSLADLTADYYKKLAAAEHHELEVVDFIDSLPESSHRMILKLRYVDRKRWSRVLKCLTDNGMDISERAMFRLHGEALGAAREKYKLMEEKERDETSDS